MKVLDTSLTGTSAAATPPSPTVSHPSGQAGTSTADLSGGDSVTFSGFAGKLGAALGAQSAGQSARVVGLERDYQAGNYNPDALATSRALVAETLAVHAGGKET